MVLTLVWSVETGWRGRPTSEGKAFCWLLSGLLPVKPPIVADAPLSITNAVASSGPELVAKYLYNYISYK